MHGTQKGLVDHMQKTPEDHKATKTKQKNPKNPLQTKKPPSNQPKHQHPPPPPQTTKNKTPGKNAAWLTGLCRASSSKVLWLPRSNPLQVL